MYGYNIIIDLEGADFELEGSFMENNELRENRESTLVGNNGPGESIAARMNRTNEFRGYRDASWEQVSKDGHTYDGSNIKFRNNRKNTRIKGALKGFAFILIAAVSGGVTAGYIANEKYSNQPYSYVPNNPSWLEQSKTSTTTELPANAITKVAETVGPTVVGISNRKESFFGKVSGGSGSGIIFDSKGYIVTNYHVIQGAEEVTVKLANSDKVFKAKYVGGDPNRDIAVIKIDAENLPVAKFGDSSKVRVGDTAVAIGNPLGEEFAGSVTAGIISAVNRNIEMQDSRTGRVTKYKVLQTDAAINPGNSGGALCNEAGEIIGINSLKIGSESNAEGMGFAITINEASDIVKSVMEGKAPDGGKDTSQTQQTPSVMLGISGSDAVPEENNGVKGVYVEQVDPDLGAAKAGIKPSDIIMQVDKTKVETLAELRDLIQTYKPGDVVTVILWRNGKQLQAKVTLSQGNQ